MVDGKDDFIAARLSYLILSTLAVAIFFGDDSCISQRLSALVYPWQRVYTPYDHCAELSVVST